MKKTSCFFDETVLVVDCRKLSRLVSNFATVLKLSFENNKITICRTSGSHEPFEVRLSIGALEEDRIMSAGIRMTGGWGLCVQK